MKLQISDRMNFMIKLFITFVLNIINIIAIFYFITLLYSWERHIEIIYNFVATIAVVLLSFFAIRLIHSKLKYKKIFTIIILLLSLIMIYLIFFYINQDGLIYLSAHLIILYSLFYLVFKIKPLEDDTYKIAYWFLSIVLPALLIIAILFI